MRILEYPFISDKFRRKYMLGCLRAFLKSSLERRFYDLGRINFWGQSATIDWGFDESRQAPDQALIAPDEVEVAKRRKSRAQVIHASETVTVCGAPRDLQYDPDVAQEVGAEDAAAAD